MRSALLLLGGNQGDMGSTLDRAANLLAARVGSVVAVSSRYITEPWGFSCEAEFTNQALDIMTELEPMALLEATQLIERELGRDTSEEQDYKSASGQRYAPRAIDIDIILLGDEIFRAEQLEIPHPRMGEREFVLQPLCEIAPQRIHPTAGVTIESMYGSLLNSIKG